MIFFYVFFYDLDLLVSKRNRLTADTIHKIFCLRSWIKIGNDCTKKKKIKPIADVFGKCTK